MKNYWAFLFFTFLLTSCNFVQKELPNSQELLRRELHAIDWSRVDTYPSYDSCEKLTDATENKKCFFERLNFEVVRVLKTDSLVKISTIDSVQFKVSISSNSEIDFKTEAVNEKLMPKFMLDSIMKKHKKDFSKIQPATKRGIPVTTQFMLHVKFDPSLD